MIFSESSSYLTWGIRSGSIQPSIQILTDRKFGVLCIGYLPADPQNLVVPHFEAYRTASRSHPWRFLRYNLHRYAELPQISLQAFPLLGRKISPNPPFLAILRPRPQHSLRQTSLRIHVKLENHHQLHRYWSLRSGRRRGQGDLPYEGSNRSGESALGKERDYANGKAGGGNLYLYHSKEVGRCDYWRNGRSGRLVSKTFLFMTNSNSKITDESNSFRDAGKLHLEKRPPR